MKKEIANLYDSITDLIRSYNLKNGYFELRTIIFQSGDNKDIALFQTYLIEVEENEAWPRDYEKAIEISKNIQKCIMEKNNYE